MKKNKGFTLVELLATIAILAIVLVIATVSVLKVIEGSKEKTRYSSAREITSIAAAYLASETEGIIKEEDEDCVTIKQLIDSGYLEKDVTNPANGKNGFEGYENSKVCKGNYSNQSGNKPGTNDKGKLGYSFDDYYYVIEGDGSQSGNTDITKSEYYKYYIWEGNKLVGLSEEGEEYYKDNKDIRIPEGTTEIGDGAFAVPIGYDGELPNMNDLYEYYEGCYITCSQEVKDKIDQAKNNLKKIYDYNNDNHRLFGMNIVFPNSLQKIGDYAFYGLIFSQDKLIFPNKVTEIGAYSFKSSGFRNTKITLSSNLKKISYEAFQATNFKGDLIIPDSVEKVEAYAFSNTSFDGKLQLSKKLKSISRYAFAHNQNGYLNNTRKGFVGDLIIPDSVEEIADGAFNKSGFTGKLKISENLKEIPDYFVSGTGLVGELQIPNNVTKIGYNSFENTLFTGQLKLPDKLVEIGNSTFQDTLFTGKLEFPKSLKKIGSRAFKNCKFEGELYIPDGMGYLDFFVFEGCNNLTSISIPKYFNYGTSVFPPNIPITRRQ